MRVLEEHDDRLAARQAHDLPDQRRQCPVLFRLRTEPWQRPPFRRRQRQQIGEQRHILVGRRGAGEQGLELLPLGRRSIVTGESGRVGELLDKREQRAVLVVRRTEIAQPEMRLAAEPLFQRRCNARLANAGLAGDQHELAVAGLGARPAEQKQVDLIVAADKWGQCRSAQRLKTALDTALSQHLPAADRLGAAGGFDRAELSAVEQVTG